MEKEIVYPGSFLGYEEEFLAGENAYSTDEGSVNSEAVGRPVVDSASHLASVSKSNRRVKIIQRGAIVYGVVSAVKQNNVLVVLKRAESEGEGFVVHDSNASLAVFNIAQSYVNDIQDMYRIGDVIRAKVIDVTSYGVELETKAPDLGVIKAYGIHSRKPLHLINGVLRDPATGAAENRKISTLYSEDLR